jgi:hypothetical protein
MLRIAKSSELTPLQATSAIGAASSAAEVKTRWAGAKIALILMSRAPSIAPQSVGASRLARGLLCARRRW